MTYCSVVEVLALVGLTKNRSGQYAILKIVSLRSPRKIKQNDFKLNSTLENRL